MELVSPSELKAWDKPGPRYTSYPTVPVWGPLGQEAVEKALGCAKPPAQVYVHVPFCAEQCSFCGCNMVVAGRREIGQKYLENVRQQVRALPLASQQIPVQRIHLGGGTPTWFTPEELQELHEILMERFTPTPDAEISIEADPQITTFAHRDALNTVGFNRLSLGVQSFDPVVLKAVNRPQWRSRIGELLDYARGLGWWGLNLDLIYGLPHQTPERFASTLKQAIDLRPDRFAVFGYAHVPWLKSHMNKIDADALPDTTGRAQLYLMTQKFLTEAGYTPLGLDHFALDSDQLAVAARERRLHRNFMGYTTLPDVDMIGLGMSAISEVGGTYWQDEPKLARWRAKVEAGDSLVERGWVLSDEDRLRRDVINSLMCNLRVVANEIEDKHPVPFWKHFDSTKEVLAPLEQAGFLELDTAGIQVSERGRVLVRNAAMAFDPYLQTKPTDGPRYSRTV
ncbi:MAG: oxygen-independent coproporphyrinogen III oxidase [Myxococcota bacterium]|nr:oxygen-independent coproporphyrinogen III oxidase [Myxococcota bacterium]